MIIFKKLFLVLSFVGIFQPLHCSYNMSLVGFVNDIRSVSRHTTSFIECLHQEIPIKFFKTRECCYKDLPAFYKDITNNGIDLTNKKIFARTRNNHPLTGITIFAETLWESWDEYASLQDNSIIRCAYCVTERTLIPKEWVKKLHNYFDVVIVPDAWLIDVYKNSGVNLPIFVLPEVLDLQSLLTQQSKVSPKKLFIFGFTGGFWPRKNHELLMKAFVAEFGNNPDVILKMHGRFENGFEKIQKIFNRIKTPNISLEQKAFSRQEYEDFITSLDCYVLLSKAEGFSITPREALAAGIPCIISNNTAHKIICDSGSVYPVPSDILEPSYCIVAGKNLGYNFNCTIDDARKALREVYSNHQLYKDKALHGREWVQQYLAKNLKPLYLNLVKPKTVILGHQNIITDEYIMTNSRKLFTKYKKLCTGIGTKFKNILKE